MHKKKPCYAGHNRVIKFGGDILSRFDPVPSAQAGLTSLFGMGRGGPRRNSHQKLLNILVSSIEERNDLLKERKYMACPMKGLNLNRKFTGN